MSPERNKSPWAYEDSELKCPRCGSIRVSRIFQRWSMSRGVQTYECHSCGKKFVERDVDDYRPTFD